jgi:uncharacterized protein YbbC (DUF1343 family)
VRFEALRFDVDPAAAKFPGATLPGVRLVVTDRESYRPVEAVLRMIDLIRRLHPEEFRWSGTMDRLAGTDQARRAIEAGALEALLGRWREEADAFERDRRPYLLYD